MDELDLDELHQNVTSMMNGRGPKAPKPAPHTEPHMTPTISEPSTPPAPTREEPREETIPVTIKRPLPSLNGRRGMAMDIIPSQTTPTSSPPSSRPTREARTVQPTGHVRPEPFTPVKPSTDAKPWPVTPAAPEPSDDMLQSLDMQKDAAADKQEGWPDPIDVHSFDDTPEPAAKEADPLPLDEPELEPEPTLVSTPEPSPAFTDASASPFVSTKVEKRPLGAFTTMASTPEVPPPPADEPSAAPEVPSPEAPAPETADAHDTPLDKLRHMAIPQQYHTPTAEPKTALHSVFDTHEYHTPIEIEAEAASLHHHSHLGWIIVAVLTLSLIGLAVAGYFMVTGGMDISRIL